MFADKSALFMRTGGDNLKSARNQSNHKFFTAFANNAPTGQGIQVLP